MDSMTSDEEIFSNDSKGNLTIRDSSESEDESINPIRPRSKFQGQRNPQILTDSEDDEYDQAERRVLSPRTRMSITGVRPKDLSDNSSLLESTSHSQYESINEVRRSSKFRGQRTSPIVSDSDEDDYDETERRALSPRTRMSITGVRPKDLSDDSSEIEYSSNEDEPSYLNNEAREEKGQKSLLASQGESELSSGSVEETFNSVGESDDERQQSMATRQANASLNEHSNLNKSTGRFSKIFEHSITDKLSSTLCQGQQDAGALKDSEKLLPDDEFAKSREGGSSSDKSLTIDEVIEASKDDSVVNISSDESSPNVFEIKKTVQPKIFSLVPKTAESRVSNLKVVSQAFYDKEVKKLSELQNDLESAENLFAKLGSSLHDGGKQLSLRVETLKRSVRAKAEEISLLKIDDLKSPVLVEKPQSTFSINNVPNWDELSAAVNQIKPVFTGKQGINTFNMQKVLTVERLKDLHGSLENCPQDNVLADDPKGLKVTLMTHQKHALAWMDWREKQKPRGGILADDMGLGKTLTVISMILACKNRDENILNQSQETDDDEEKENEGWSSKGRKDYYNGGTLVVCPASLLRQWENEVESKVTRHKLSVSVHHGNNRDAKPRHLATYDIVVTTYNIVSREVKTHGALFAVNWKRIILDEAHVVRNHKSQSSMAVCALKSRFRWALTGTPIQNKEMDVYALLKFLKVTPFDDLAHWKKWIDNKSAGGQQRLNTLMKSLMLRRTKAQLQQQGSLICLPEREQLLIDVNLDKDEMNVYQKIMTYSKTLFAQYLFQRAEKNNDLYFLDQGTRPTFMQTKDPNGAYHKMHEKFSKMHHGGKEIKSHEILVLLLRLRQICCHPGLIDAMLEDEDEGAHSDSQSIEPEIDLLEQLNKLAIDKSDSGSVLTDSIGNDSGHEAISKASAKVLQRSNPVFNLARPSSKMIKVLEVVEKNILNTDDKGIIISQWTSILNILKSHLDAKGIRTLSLNGTIPVKNRQNIVEEFNDPRSKPKILLLSLTAGGVGLNLVGANHLLLIDLHWNPQLESQAQDRIYRVGQKKFVHIYKFMCKDTVEERIKALQDQKLGIADGVLTGVKASEGSKLSIDDLKGLFGL